jgi:hypothetical protein
MRILLAIVHHWNPEGGGRHGSLRPDPAPRLEAFEQQLLALQRLGARQAELNIAAMEARPANQALQHEITIAVITDGEHHLIDRLHASFNGLYWLVLTTPPSPRHLGFEAQRFLASRLDEGYDLYGYLEDDLIIHDPLFFHKIAGFSRTFGSDNLLLPHRVEMVSHPHPVDRFYIDGTMPADELRRLIPEPPQPLVEDRVSGKWRFESPGNPHAGCFFLSHGQLTQWSQHPCWQDGDVSLVSPLESAATLGISKVFQLYKPALEQAGWLELQHWGNSFHSLLGRTVTLPGYETPEAA